MKDCRWRAGRAWRRWNAQRLTWGRGAGGVRVEDGCEVPEAMLGCGSPLRTMGWCQGLLFSVLLQWTPYKDSWPPGLHSKWERLRLCRDSRVICCQPAESEKDQR